MSFEPKIYQEKQDGKTDSFFYDGLIASITKPNGTELELIACGDIRINIGEDTYKNSWEAEIDHELTDKKLAELNKDGEIEWCMNNWFEVIWKQKEAEQFDSDIGVVAGDYDEAIDLLESYYEDEAY